MVQNIFSSAFFFAPEEIVCVEAEIELSAGGKPVCYSSGGCWTRGGTLRTSTSSPHER
jgi:hypothetical protein